MKEKRRQKIAAFICAIILILIFTTQGQTMKINTCVDFGHDGKFACKAPSYPMTFNISATNDTLFCMIIADSIRKDIYSVMLYTYFTKGFTPPDRGIKVWYDDGTFDDFEVYEYDKIGRNIKYNIVNNNLCNLHTKKVQAIDFKGVLLCIDIKTKNYFIDFLNLYDK